MGKLFLAVVCFGAGIGATLLAMAGGLFDPKTTAPVGKEWGEFPSSPKVELLSDGRTVRLLEDFAYIDPAKKVWVARKDRRGRAGRTGAF